MSQVCFARDEGGRDAGRVELRKQHADFRRASASLPSWAQVTVHLSLGLGHNFVAGCLGRMQRYLG